MIRYPNIIGKTDTQKLEQMKSYLHQLADELNFQLEKVSKTASSNYASSVDSSAKPVKKDNAVSNFDDVKSLIIKSSDIVSAYYAAITRLIDEHGLYVAESEFGTYKETTDAQINANSTKIEAVVTRQEEIDTDMEDLERTLRSEIEQTADSISMTVENGDSTAQIVLKVGDKEIPATIDMKGLVTFSNLANADGNTVINGSNITTGSISADLITTGTLAADVVKLTAEGVENYTFNSVEELNEFVEGVADSMKPNTQKTIGATFYAVAIGGTYMNGYGTVTVSVGVDAEGLKSAVATLVADGTARRTAYSHGDYEDGHEVLIWRDWGFPTNTLFGMIAGDMASFTSEEVYKHTLAGGDAVLYANGSLYYLASANESEAMFSHSEEGGYTRTYVIYGNGYYDVRDEEFAYADHTHDEQNVATYNTFQQLGLTASCTISEVFKAMPAPAIFIFSHSAGSPYVVTDAPHNYCIIEVVKSSTNFGVARAINVSSLNAIPYTGSLYYDAANASVIFSGWRSNNKMASLWSGSLTGKNSITFPYSEEYSAYVIIGRPANSTTNGRESVTVPTELITTSAVYYQLADETTYNVFTLARNSTTVTLTKTNTYGTIEYVYGIR